MGDPSLVRSKISLKAMLRTLRKEKGGYFVELNVVEKDADGEVEKEDINATVPDFLKAVINEKPHCF